MKKLNRVWNKTGMRQLVDTPHKTFNQQTNCLDNCSNCISNTQVCFNIRAYNNTINPIGEIVDPGYLQNFDFNQFENLPQQIKDFCRRDVDATWWISEIRIFDNNGRKHVICYFIVDRDTEKVYTYYCGKNSKQLALKDWLVNYLFEEGVK